MTPSSSVGFLVSDVTFGESSNEVDLLCQAKYSTQCPLCKLQNVHFGVGLQAGTAPLLIVAASNTSMGVRLATVV